MTELVVTIVVVVIQRVRAALGSKKKILFLFRSERGIVRLNRPRSNFSNPADDQRVVRSEETSETPHSCGKQSWTARHTPSVNVKRQKDNVVGRGFITPLSTPSAELI